MGPAERRQAIWTVLCKRRHDTAANLASEFGVSQRTIWYDIEELIRPWLVRIQQAMDRALFPETEKGRFYVRFNLDGLMRGDYKSRMEGYAIARQNGWMSANDIRELENLNPLSDEEGGNLYLVNGNMVPITMTAADTGKEDADAQVIDAGKPV